jgi:hypothetical protein
MTANADYAQEVLQPYHLVEFEGDNFDGWLVDDSDEEDSDDESGMSSESTSERRGRGDEELERPRSKRPRTD